MAFIDDLFMWAIIFGLGYVAYNAHIKPELERRKTAQRNEKYETDKTIKPVALEADFKEVK